MILGGRALYFLLGGVLSLVALLSHEQFNDDVSGSGLTQSSLDPGLQKESNLLYFVL
jgi:hypothetical protein